MTYSVLSGTLNINLIDVTYLRSINPYSVFHRTYTTSLTLVLESGNGSRVYCLIGIICDYCSRMLRVVETFKFYIDF